MFGALFFTWDGGDPVRVGALLRAAGTDDLRLASEPEAARVRAGVAAMPRWPNPGAIRLIEGVLIVKLGG